MKDEVLNSLAELGCNMAQFISCGPDRKIRFKRIRNSKSGVRNKSIKKAIKELLSQSASGTVNIRTFLADKPDGNPFVYGKNDIEEIVGLINKFTEEGYYIIVNETIIVNDGGFSGVIFGDLMEGAPNDIPRCVEKPGCMRFPRSIGFEFIHDVYGFHFHMPFGKNHRVEFSVHPHNVGYLQDRYIIWQVDKFDEQSLPVAPDLQWPNRMSSAMGDKAFGLLMASLMRMPVPYTTVFGRLIPQFSFGTKIHSEEPVWVRTVPKEQTPGKFQTTRGWKDPFTIMQEDDPENTKIASIIIQNGIKAHYSGAVITNAEGEMIIEGCKGYGDKFMTGEKSPDQLPENVINEVNFLFERVYDKVGPIRFEWAYDGRQAWILQLHRGKTETLKNVIYPGMPKRWIEFNIESGLEALRDLVEKEKDNNSGIRVVGDIGLTSHFGDIIRRAKIPAVQVPSKNKAEKSA